MMKTKLLSALGLAGLALLAIGCGPPPGPDKPSFATDIKPIMMAHCVRCHGAGGTLNADPNSIGAAYRNKPPMNTYLDTYENPTCAAGTVCYGAKTSAGSIKVFVTAADSERMPPLPSDPLSDVQKELIVRWAVDKLP
jgi:hypothetical protein